MTRPRILTTNSFEAASAHGAQPAGGDLVSSSTASSQSGPLHPRILTDRVYPPVPILTDLVFPPIPIRTFDWQAWYAGEDDQQMDIGWGRTEQEAIQDLTENYPR